MPWHPPEGHGWAVVYPLLRDVFLSLGILSLGSCAAVVLFYRALPQVRRTPGWLVQRATLCEALVSACFVALFFFGAPHASLPSAQLTTAHSHHWGDLKLCSGSGCPVMQPATQCASCRLPSHSCAACVCAWARPPRNGVCVRPMD